MNKLLLILAFITLFSTIYFLFITRQLLYGSISALSCVVLNVLYAMSSSENKVSEKN